MEKPPSPPLRPRRTPASPQAGGQVPFGQAAPGSRHADGQGAPTPRRDSPPAVRQPPSLPRAAGGAQRDGGPVVPAPPHGWITPRSGNTSRPEEGGVGRGVKKHPGGLARGMGCEPGGVTSFGRGEKGMCPFMPAERRACVRLSSSSTPDLMAIPRDKPTSPSLPDSDAPSPGLLEGRHSPIVSHPPPPLASKSSSDPTGHLPSPGGFRAAGTGAQRPPLRAGERSFPLLRSGRAAPAPSPQPGAPKVSAGGSQPGRHWRLHSRRDEVGGGRGGRRGGPHSSRDAPPRWLPTPPSGCLSPGPARSLLRAVLRCSPAPSVRPSRSPSPAPLPGGEPRGAQAPPAARRTRGRRGIPARPPVLSPGPGAHSPRGEEALPRPGRRRAAPRTSVAPWSRAQRGSLRHRRGRCYYCRPGLSGRWVPRSARGRSVPVPRGRLRV